MKKRSRSASKPSPPTELQEANLERSQEISLSLLDFSPPLGALFLEPGVDFGAEFVELFHALRSRKLLVTTDTLDIAIAADAIIGDSIHPVHG